MAKIVPAMARPIEPATWRKKVARAQALEAEDADGRMRAALATLLALPPLAYSEDQWATLSAMLELLPRAVGELKVLFGERGQVDFTEIAQGAVRALGEPEEPTDLLLSLDVRVKHILVDEFQDTSLVQWTVLEPLAKGVAHGEGTTFFCVGDVKQAIYGWRGGEAEIFEALNTELTDITIEPLDQHRTSFRLCRRAPSLWNFSSRRPFRQ